MTEIYLKEIQSLSIPIAYPLKLDDKNNNIPHPYFDYKTQVCSKIALDQITNLIFVEHKILYEGSTHSYLRFSKGFLSVCFLSVCTKFSNVSYILSFRKHTLFWKFFQKIILKSNYKEYERQSCTICEQNLTRRLHIHQETCTCNLHYFSQMITLSLLITLTLNYRNKFLTTVY